jgi:hypothetical protein
LEISVLSLEWNTNWQWKKDFLKGYRWVTDSLTSLKKKKALVRFILHITKPTYFRYEILWFLVTLLLSGKKPWYSVLEHFHLPSKTTLPPLWLFPSPHPGLGNY